MSLLLLPIGHLEIELGAGSGWGLARGGSLAGGGESAGACGVKCIVFGGGEGGLCCLGGGGELFGGDSLDFLAEDGLYVGGSTIF